jgi:hypothetical protein
MVSAWNDAKNLSLKDGSSSNMFAIGENEVSTPTASSSSEAVPSKEIKYVVIFIFFLIMFVFLGKRQSLKVEKT